MTIDPFWLVQAGVAALATGIFLLNAWRAHRVNAIVGSAHIVRFLLLVSAIAALNIITAGTNAFDLNPEIRNTAGLLIRVILILAAAYATSIINWSDKD